MIERLHPADLERLADEVADRVAARLGGEPAGALVDAATLADRLGLSRDYVYAHAAQLGGRKAPGGRNAPVRFDVAEALAAMGRLSVGDDPPAPGSPVAPRHRRLRRPSPRRAGATSVPESGAQDAPREAA